MNDTNDGTLTVVTDDAFSLAEAERDTTGSTCKSSRRFLDFVVNGEHLAFKLWAAGYDLVSSMWLDNATAAPEGIKAAHRLLGHFEGDAPHGRVRLYSCAECGDLGCGAITVRLETSQQHVSWVGWGYQNDYEDEVYELNDALRLRDLVFDRQEYEGAFAHAIRRLEEAR